MPSVCLSVIMLCTMGKRAGYSKNVRTSKQGHPKNPTVKLSTLYSRLEPPKFSTQYDRLYQQQQQQRDSLRSGVVLKEIIS